MCPTSLPSSWALFVAVGALAAFSVNLVIDTNVFVISHPHRPGRCKLFSMNGSEDMALLPNRQLIISSGVHFWQNDYFLARPEPALYVLDMDRPFDGPTKLTFEGSYLNETNPEFSPHGLDYWIDSNGDILIYVISHWRQHDGVEVFRYKPESKSVEYLRGFRHPLMFDLNSLIVIGEDEFYVTTLHYFQPMLLKLLETMMPFSFMHITYFNGRTGEVKYAATELQHPNGISISTNKEFIYLAHTGGAEVAAFKRNEDNTLSLVQTFPLPIGVDNLFVDPTNGHIWLGLHRKPFKLLWYFIDHSFPSPGAILHMTVDENSPLPFFESKIEEVFASDGEEVSATSMAVYYNHTLVIGSIHTELTVCEVSYLMYGQD